MKWNRALFVAVIVPILFVILVVLNFTLFAQDEDNADLTPFERYLALIPAQSDTPLTVSYADYAAFEETREGVPAIDSWAELEALENDASEEAARQRGLWIASFNGISVGTDLFRDFSVGETSSVLGFEVLAIDRALLVGQAPSQAILVSGDWTAQAVIDAHLARGYTQEQRGDITLLCPEAGCDSGTMVNLNARDPKNIFGGDLGRQWPILVKENWVMASPSDQILERIIRVASGEAESLLDVPSVRATVNHIHAAEGRLRQAQLLDASRIGTYEDQILTMFQGGDAEATIPETDYPIAPYALLAFSDHITDTQQMARALLLFEDESAAQQAAESVSGRLTADVSLMFRQPYPTLFTDMRNAQIETGVLSEADLFIAEITFTDAQPSNEPLEDMPFYPESAMTFSLLMQMLNQLDLLWLAPNAP